MSTTISPQVVSSVSTQIEAKEQACAKRFEKASFVAAIVSAVALVAICSLVFFSAVGYIISVPVYVICISLFAVSIIVTATLIFIARSAKEKAKTSIQAKPMQVPSQTTPAKISQSTTSKSFKNINVKRRIPTDFEKRTLEHAKKLIVSLKKTNERTPPADSFLRSNRKGLDNGPSKEHQAKNNDFSVQFIIDRDKGLTIKLHNRFSKERREKINDLSMQFTHVKSLEAGQCYKKLDQLITDARVYHLNCMMHKDQKTVEFKQDMAKFKELRTKMRSHLSIIRSSQDHKEEPSQETDEAPKSLSSQRAQVQKKTIKPACAAEKICYEQINTRYKELIQERMVKLQIFATTFSSIKNQKRSEQLHLIDVLLRKKMHEFNRQYFNPLQDYIYTNGYKEDFSTFKTIFRSVLRYRKSLKEEKASSSRARVDSGDIPPDMDDEVSLIEKPKQTRPEKTEKKENLHMQLFKAFSNIAKSKEPVEFVPSIPGAMTQKAKVTSKGHVVFSCDTKQKIRIKLSPESHTMAFERKTTNDKGGKFLKINPEDLTEKEVATMNAMFSRFGLNTCVTKESLKTMKAAKTNTVEPDSPVIPPKVAKI